jgi:hypothetical protein
LLLCVIYGPSCELTMTEPEEGSKPVFKRAVNVEPKEMVLGDWGVLSKQARCKMVFELEPISSIL